MTSTHKTRAQMSRTKSNPVSELDAPKPPPGTKYRWMRVSIQGQDDAKNWMKKQRAGWEPVMQSEHPDFRGTTPGAGFEGVIANGDLILVKNSVEASTAIRDEAKEKTDRMQSAIKNDYMRYGTPAMPTTASVQSSITTGGRKTQFDND